MGKMQRVAFDSVGRREGFWKVAMGFGKAAMGFGNTALCFWNTALRFGNTAQGFCEDRLALALEESGLLLMA
ncbi:MAG: hypothetical protein QE274_12605 [Verrucomicrobiaceae bacterium]|nr:hypothetical protein [Verrucomicrobiaceae bacterium]